MQFFKNFTLSFKNSNGYCWQVLKFAIFLSVFTVTINCSGITNNTQDRLVARAENHFLYLSDIEDALDSFQSKEDSLVKVRNFINNWARKKLIYEKSLVNLPESKIAELNSMVDNYESNLFRNAYREFVLKSLMDTMVNSQLITEFYQSNKQNFKLREPLHRIRFISFPFDNVDRKEIIKRFRRFEPEDITFLDSLSFQFSSYFLADSLWLNQVETFEKVTFLDNDNANNFLKKKKYYEVKDSLDLYLFELVERLERNELAPLPYIENTIRSIVFNKKKIEFLKVFDNDILEDAIKTTKFETY